MMEPTTRPRPVPATLPAAAMFMMLAAVGIGCGSAVEAREAEVRARVAEFAEAFQQADVERLKGMLGPRYAHTNTGGGFVDAASWLAYVASRRDEIRSGRLAYSRYENRDVEVRLHGDVAVVTGVNVSEGVRDGAPFARALRFTQVWVRRQSGWVRIAFHDTEVATRTRPALAQV